MGWDLDDFDDLNDVLGDIRDATYEIDHCVRGCNTRCHTYKELADYLDELGERLSAAACYLRHMKDDMDENGEEDDD